MEVFDIFAVLQSLVSVLPSMGILAATIYYVSQRQSADAYLLFIGSLVGALTQLFYSVVLPRLINNGTLGIDFYQHYALPIGLVATIGAAAFAIGLFMLIHETVRVRQ